MFTKFDRSMAAGSRAKEGKEKMVKFAKIIFRKFSQQPEKT
jgi:hypothetical protein